MFLSAEKFRSSTVQVGIILEEKAQETQGVFVILALFKIHNRSADGDQEMHLQGSRSPIKLFKVPKKVDRRNLSLHTVKIWGHQMKSIGSVFRAQSMSD